MSGMYLMIRYSTDKHAEAHPRTAGRERCVALSGSSLPSNHCTGHVCPPTGEAAAYSPAFPSRPCPRRRRRASGWRCACKSNRTGAWSRRREGRWSGCRETRWCVSPARLSGAAQKSPCLSRKPRAVRPRRPPLVPLMQRRLSTNLACHSCGGSCRVRRRPSGTYAVRQRPTAASCSAPAYEFLPEHRHKSQNNKKA